MKAIAKNSANIQNILLIDEVVSVNEMSNNKSLCVWSKMNPAMDNVDFLIALNPQGVRFMNKFRVTPPKNKNTLSQQLTYKHRNSFECDSVVEHFKSLPNTSYLDTCNDMKLEPTYLPMGRTPLWFEEMTEIDVQTIFDFIKDDHILDQETVTLLFNEHELGNDRRQNMELFCIKNGWQFQHYSHFFGCEDQVIILFECSLLFELISRGRNQVIFITNKKYL